MKILLLGASGTVGTPLYRILSADNKYKVHGTYNTRGNDMLHKLDISDTAALDTLLETTHPNMIISSLTGDFDVQLQAHRHMLSYLQKTNGQMVFISTANIFDGDVTGSHAETKAPYPISNYGKFKQRCEVLLQNGLNGNCLIIRLPKVMDEATRTKWLHQAKTGEPPVYENLHFGLNSAENVAAAIKHCIDVRKNGVLHLTSHDTISSTECANFLLAQAGEEKGYTPQRLTVEEFCSMLGSSDHAALRIQNNEFRMDLACTNAEIGFGISCMQALAGL